ncbi:peptidoglycan-recognition protein LC isoform X2 [Leptinotarsa decemlineata]|uniref:peptidoglycan-recognition protein LC isoform X2 n=1 Tax=Leptinotarsa decemlineata TaxID=7539 RepID=UPI003D30C4DC
MTQSSLSRPSYSGSDNEVTNDVEDYQVDTYSTSSCQELEDDDIEGTIAIPQQDLPHFGSVSVVNSNDVHFGNKTVYKGPVTIKQFVYPNGDITSEDLSGLSDCAKKIDLTSGVINNGYVKGEGDKDNNGKAKGISEDTAESTVPVTGLRKGYFWTKNFWKKRPTETMIVLILIVVLVTLILALTLWKHSVTNPLNDSNETINAKVHIISRFTWLAQPPIEPTDPLKLPVSLVIVHHTATEVCYSRAQCIYQTRHIQTFHIESNGWSDIGYNFLIGGDGDVYEGRGWKKEGAHSYGYNYKSLGIAFIGTFISSAPPENMISAFHKLMDKGVELGVLTSDYKILAARQLAATESPGKSFFEVIKTWAHWSKKP